jgi:hypothetical protein
MTGGEHTPKSCKCKIATDPVEAPRPRSPLGAGSAGLRGAVTDVPFNFAVGFRLAPAPFALVIQGAMRRFLLIGEADVHG